MSPPELEEVALVSLAQEAMAQPEQPHHTGPARQQVEEAEAADRQVGMAPPLTTVGLAGMAGHMVGVEEPAEYHLRKAPGLILASKPLGMVASVPSARLPRPLVPFARTASPSGRWRPGSTVRRRSPLRRGPRCWDWRRFSCRWRWEACSTSGLRGIAGRHGPARWGWGWHWASCSSSSPNRRCRALGRNPGSGFNCFRVRPLRRGPPFREKGQSWKRPPLRRSSCSRSCR